MAAVSSLAAFRSRWTNVDCSHPGVLKGYFARFGSVAYFKMAKNKKNKEPLGFGFLEFKEDTVALEVLASKHYIGGREVRCGHPDRREAL